MLCNKIIIEFILKLPRSKKPKIKKKYNTIVVIVDKTSKYFYIILFKKKDILD